MALFDFLKSKPQIKSPVEKFEAIKAYVQAESEFLMNDNFEGMSTEESANKILYQTMDWTIREKLSEEANKKVDRANDTGNVLEALKEEVSSGRISKVELQEIFNSQEFKDYTKID